MPLDPRIRRIGHLFSLDAEGFLVNPCHARHIVSPWDVPVQAVVEAYRSGFPDTLHSVYLRGTVPRGLAIAGVSDLDTLAVLNGALPKQVTAWEEAAAASLLEHVPGRQHVELSVWELDGLLEAPNYAVPRALMATQCLCVFGDDLVGQMPRIRPGLATVSHAQSLGADIDETLEGMPQDPQHEDREDWCRWIMKRLVRTGLELFMEEERVFSRDLYPCYALFAERYPDRAAEMARALEWAVFPTADIDAIAPTLEGLGRWLAARGVAVYGEP